VKRVEILITKIVTTFYRRVVVFSRAVDGAYPQIHSSLPTAISVLQEEDLLEYQRFRTEQNLQMIRKRLTAGDRCFLVRVEGRIVHSGWIATQIKQDPYLRCTLTLQPGDIFLYDHYTAPAFRSRGLSIAREIHILKHYLSEGYRRSVAIVAIENKPAFRPFEALGYRPIGMLFCLRWVLGEKIWRKSYGADPLPDIVQLKGRES
jgi:hypothetical protein